MKTRHESRASGFTLVELLAVITIIVLLAGALVVSVGYFSKRAGNARTLSILMTVEQGIKSFHEDFGVYPPEYWNSLNAQFFRDKGAANNPLNRDLSDGTKYEPEYLFNIDASFNFSSEILYYYLIKRFETPQTNDGIYLPRKTPYIELPDYAVGDVDGDGNMEIVDAWGNPILYVAKDLYFDAPFGETEDESQNMEPHPDKNENSFSLYSYGNDGLGFYEMTGEPDYPVQHKSPINDKTEMKSAISAKYGDSNATGQAKANRDNVTNW